MTKTQAGLLADTMPNAAFNVLKAFGLRDVDGIPVSAIEYLKKQKLIKQTENLLTHEMVWVLTSDGKKVRKYL